MSQDADSLRRAVRERYAATATSGCGCGPSASRCCSSKNYDAEELASIPEGADLGLGCGNPVAISSLREGETVLDLGSGAGVDCFLAARRVGPRGRVIGVDMTPEMLHKARENARRGGYENVEFRLGEIEHLPVPDETVDVILSNCVVNLSPDKGGVFAEAFRVLRPGGRIAISDIVTIADIPQAMRDDVAHYTGCVSGAVSAEENERLLREAGFIRVSVEPRAGAKGTDDPLADYVASASIEAVKPPRALS
jgi:arsenite methyltransferase